MQVLGFDIGGANIKAATSDGLSCSVPFEMWKRRDELSSQLNSLRQQLCPVPDVIAIVMTAELADCFASRAEGVDFIVTAARDVFSDFIVRIWLTSGEFAEPEDAIELPQLAAASNWHALATWAARAAPQGPALLIDIGSTTVDLIPILNGTPQPQGLSDLERLRQHELIYTGVRRTPVCAIVREVPLVDADGSEEMVPIAAELFATSLDVHLIVGDLPENPNDTATADGRPATRSAAMNRLAHMLCCDGTDLSEEQLRTMAEYIASEQLNQILDAIENRLYYLQTLAAEGAGSTKSGTPAPRILISGSGAWLGEKALERIDESAVAGVCSLSNMFVRNVSDCAPAFAAARLAAERCLDDLLPLNEL
ncbi:MAG: hydantoinase/oxoprolinase family protein [Planctomycetota bacterium]